jgi:excisionase family DNA binding protein
MPNASPEYLTTADVAELLRTAPSTVRYWRHIGEGPPGFKVGRRVLYARTAVDAFIAERIEEDKARGTK